MGKPQSRPTVQNRMLFGIGVFVFLFVACMVWGLIESAPDATPGKTKDDVFYDNIAFNIVSGNGYSYDFSIEEWRKPYVETNFDEINAWALNTEIQAGPTTSRAPGFVYLLAAIYKTVGRDWAVVRLVNAFILAVGLSILICCVRKHFGNLVALISMATTALDFGVLSTCGQIMTEALGTTMLVVTFTVLIDVWNKMVCAEHSRAIPLSRWAIIGILFGLTMLVRSNLIAWLMLLFGLVGLLIVIFYTRKKLNEKANDENANLRKLLQSAVVFFFCAILVCLPWWVRNCIVSRHFSPFGSAGDIGWVGGYSDEAFENNGNWYLPNVVNLQKEWMAEYGAAQADTSLAEKEYMMGQRSKEVGLKWIKNNLNKMPELMIKKGLNHFALIDQPQPWIPFVNLLLMIGVFTGIVLSWKRFGFWIALILFMSAVSTMLLWSHHGRYSIPIRPLWHVTSAIGVVCFWSRVFRFVNQRRQ